MRILMIAKHPVYLLNFRSTLSLLSERGHDLHIALEGVQKRGSQNEILNRMREELVGAEFEFTPRRSRDATARLARDLRVAGDYLRFFHRRYDDAPTLRERASDTAPEWARVRSERWPWRTRPGRALLRGALSALERSIPPSPDIEAFVRDRRPDLVLVTPFVSWGTPQVDYVRAAMRLGVPTGLLVKSWDNLSSKGLVREVPDVVTVWNDAQRREATEMHRIPAERVVVTGAQAWDEWFERSPSLGRAEFARKVGLRPKRPFLLYLGFSPMAEASREVEFVTSWVERVRASSDERLSRMGVLIRPHPKRAGEWREVDLSALGNVTVWPREGRFPVEPEEKADFFDSMYHASAVIGINTSAMIESAIVGHQVFTVAVPEFAKWQEGMLHFRYLRDEGGGLLKTAGSLDEHVGQLEEALRGDGQSARANPRALEALVRPHGLDRPATPLIVDALEDVGARGVARRYRPPRSRVVGRAVVRRMAARYEAEDATAGKPEKRRKRPRQPLGSSPPGERTPKAPATPK